MHILRLPAYIRCILFCCLFLLPNGAYAANVVKLSGHISMPLSDTVEVSYNDNFLAYYPQKFTAMLDKKGSFKLSFPVPEGIYTLVQITHGNRLTDIVVATGDSLVMEVNAKRFDSSVRYSGRGGNTQNFVAAHILKIGRINQYPNRIKNLLHNEPNAFIAATDHEYSIETAFVDKWAPPLPETFVGYWKAFYKYYNYFFIQQYPQTHEMLKQRRYTDTIPDTNYAVVRHMPMAFNDSFLQVPSYLLYLTGVLEITMKADGYSWLGADTLKSMQFEDSVYRLAYSRMPNKSLEYFIAQNIYGRAKVQRLARTEEQLALFRERWPASSYMALVDKQVGVARRLAPGQTAPDFEIRGADGNAMRLSDLKGKVVYLGFWAGWCRQCVGEMMGEKMVKDLIRKKPLVFVYASIGSDTAMERLIAEKYKIDGLFTNFAGGWDSKEVAMYGVQGLPSYFLIDEEGKFALQHAPSPGQTTELVMQIEKLFK